MVTEVTEGIKISVETAYQPSYSYPKKSLYLFSYRVDIENCSDQAVKPILKPGENHCYSSTCDLSTEIGKMKGTYLMERIMTGNQFYVNIPEFSMVVNHLLN